MTEVSVLLPVRNWNLTRVDACVRSILRSVAVDVEVVLVDYGSDDPLSIAELAVRHNCTFVRVDAEIWSRSNAMNTAANAASGRYLVFADADFIYSPTAIAETVRCLESNPNTVIAFQVRDLPFNIKPDDLLDDVDFNHLDAGAVWRPRWGMGAQAQSKRAFDEIRGFDSRMKIYGGEDNDIAKRARAHGYRITWVTSPAFAIYHMWHPSSRVLADSSLETKQELQKNVDIVKNDTSIVRNLKSWNSRDPLVSIVIATHNRADYLAESIESALNQTVQDFEILVFDDGSTDDTARVIASIPDSRIRYFQEPKSGIPALRNKALHESRGKFTAIHDDDDLMLPWSLESRLKAVRAGTSGAYGGAYDFDNNSGEMTLFKGRKSEHATVLNGGKVSYHATLLIETDVLRAVRYDEAFQSGSDYNLSLRLMKSGVSMVHSGEIVLLRRLHRRQVTATDQVVQHGASYASSFAHRVAWGANSRWKSRERSKEIAPWSYPAEVANEERFYPYLPGHLVERGAIFAIEADQPLTDGEIEGSVVMGGARTEIAFCAAAGPAHLAAIEAKSGPLNSVHVALREETSSPVGLLLKTIRSAFDDVPVVAINSNFLSNGFEIQLDETSFVVAGARSAAMEKCIVLRVPAGMTADQFIAQPLASGTE